MSSTRRSASPSARNSRAGVPSRAARPGGVTPPGTGMGDRRKPLAWEQTCLPSSRSSCLRFLRPGPHRRRAPPGGQRARRPHPAASPERGRAPQAPVARSRRPKADRPANDTAHEEQPRVEDGLGIRARTSSKKVASTGPLPSSRVREDHAPNRNGSVGSGWRPASATQTTARPAGQQVAARSRPGPVSNGASSTVPETSRGRGSSVRHGPVRCQSSQAGHRSGAPGTHRQVEEQRWVPPGRRHRRGRGLAWSRHRRPRIPAPPRYAGPGGGACRPPARASSHGVAERRRPHWPVGTPAGPRRATAPPVELKAWEGRSRRVTKAVTATGPAPRCQP